MKRFVVLSIVFLFLSVSAFAGSPWYDDRLDGEYLPAFDGLVLYDMDVIEAPISLPEPVGLYIGHATGTGDALSFFDWYGTEYTGQFHPDTGCYLSTTDLDVVVVALCYDGARAVDIFYGTLVWDGHTAILSGPWSFHIYAYAPEGPLPMSLPGGARMGVE